MFEATKRRISRIQTAAATGLPRAAQLIQDRFRKDATTKRGNVPSFGKMGDVPIAAEPRPESIVITAPAWCTQIAKARNQNDAWRAHVVDEVGKAATRGR